MSAVRVEPESLEPATVPRSGASRRIRAALLCAPFLLACPGEEPVQSPVTGVSPRHGSLGTEVSIQGSKLPTDVLRLRVSFQSELQGEVEVPVLEASSDRLLVAVPFALRDSVEIVVAIDGAAAPSMGFDVDALLDPTPSDMGNEARQLYEEIDAFLVSMEHELGIGLYPALEALGAEAQVADLRRAIADLQRAYVSLASAHASRPPEERSAVDALVSLPDLREFRSALAMMTERLSHSTTSEALESIAAVTNALGDLHGVLVRVENLLILAQVAAGTAAAGLALVPGAQLEAAAAAAAVAYIETALDSFVRPIMFLVRVARAVLEAAPTEVVTGSFRIVSYSPDYHVDQYFPDAESLPDPGSIIIPLPYAVRGEADFTNGDQSDLEQLANDSLPLGLKEVAGLLGGIRIPRIDLTDVEVKLALESQAGRVRGTWANDELQVQGVAPGMTEVQIWPDLEQVRDGCIGIPGRGSSGCVPRSSVTLRRVFEVLSAPVLETVVPDVAYIGDPVGTTGRGLARILIPYQRVWFTPPLDGAFGDGRAHGFSDVSFVGYSSNEVPDAVTGHHWVTIDDVPSNRLPFEVLSPRLDYAHPSAIIGESYPVTGRGFSHTIDHNSASFGGGTTLPFGPGSASAPDESAHERLELIVPTSAQSGPFSVTTVGQLVSNTVDVTTRSFSTPLTLSASTRSGLRPQVARAADGRQIVAFIDRAPGAGGSMLVASVRSSASSEWSAPQIVSRDLGGLPSAPPRPAVAVGTGGYHAAWVALSDDRDVIQYSSSADGLIWSVPQSISTATTSASQPAIAVGGGFVIIAWVQGAAVEGQASRLSTRRAGVGQPFGPERSIFRFADVADPALSAVGDTVALVWSEVSANTNAPRMYRRDLFGILSENGGADLGSASPVNLAPGGTLRHPSVAVRPNASCPAKVYVAWEASSYGIQLTRWDGGVRTFPIVEVHRASGARHDHAPALSVDDDCTPSLAWLEQGHELRALRHPFPFTSLLWLARSFDGGQTFNAPFMKRIEQSGARLGHVALASGGRGFLTLAYQDDCRPSIGGCDAAEPSSVRVTTTEGSPTTRPSQPANESTPSRTEWVLRAFTPFVGSGQASLYAPADLFATTSMGERMQRVTHDGGALVGHPAFSPDGRYIAYGHSSVQGLRVIEADGSHPMTLAFEIDGGHRPVHAYWPPPGDRIYYSYLTEPTGEAPVGCDSLHRNGNADQSSPRGCAAQRSSRDGQLRLGVEPPLVRTAVADYGAVSLLDANDLNPVALTSGSDARQPIWSPADDTIAFVSNREGNDEIFLTTPWTEPGDESRLTFDEREDSDPLFLADGQLVVRSRLAGGASELKRIDGAGATVVVLSSGGLHSGGAGLLVNGFDFTLSVSSPAAFVNAGASVSVDVRVSALSSAPISLSLEGAPPSITSSFTPNPTPGIDATLTLSPGVTTATGTYNLVVRGVLGVEERVAPFNLTVLSAPPPAGLALVYCSCIGAPLGQLATVCADVPTCVSGMPAPPAVCDSVCTQGSRGSSCEPNGCMAADAGVGDASGSD